MGSTSIEMMCVDTKDEVSERQIEEEIEDLEWSADQEILLLYSLHGFKPVGPNKHFRMILIQERLSSAMNKNVSSKAIWKKLNTLYDLEALDEAEAEADAAAAVETEFSLPEDDFGELMAEKIKTKVKVEKPDDTNENNFIQKAEDVDIKPEVDALYQENEADNSKETGDTPKGGGVNKEPKKESAKRGPKKKDLSGKDNVSLKKDNAKDTPKKDTPNKKDAAKETKKTATKEDDKKETVKKANLELKKDLTDGKKEQTTKIAKKDVADKKITEQSKKENEGRKSEPKKTVDTPKNQRADTTKSRLESPKQLRADNSKAKSQKVETPRLQRMETTPKTQRNDSKKDLSTEKKKEAADKKIERKSPEKTPESGRGAKLRTREKKDTESEKPETPTGTKRERSRDSVSKATDATTEDPPAKKAKTPLPKGRPTRNSIEPSPKPASPVVLASPQKRRTRLQ